MRTQSIAEKDTAAGLVPPVRPRTPWRVSEVAPLGGFRLQVRFVDGISGIVDMSALVHSPSAGVFAELADPAIFAQVFIEHGAVTWPGEIDLAPDAMHAEVKRSGIWTL